MWEGDRRPLGANAKRSLADAEKGGECILWVDGSQGMVRAMDVVMPEAGLEAVVRALLRAIEHPHSPAQPALPQKIVVKNKELQFFLRGALQDLDITIEYVPALPLIDEIFLGFQEAVNTMPPKLPPQYAEALHQKACDLWEDAPWELLGDHQILAIEIDLWDIHTLYACVLGMAGLDYGIVLYRSMESLKRFRQQALADNSIEKMEEAFLGQDCFFLTYDRKGKKEDEANGIDLALLSWSEIQPTFGNLHPLEGLRSHLYEEEANAVWVALEALDRFWRNNSHKLDVDPIPATSGRYKIAPLNAPENAEPLSVKVSTMPTLAEELLDMAAPSESTNALPMLRGAPPLLGEDLVPEDAIVNIGWLKWSEVHQLQKKHKEFQEFQKDLPDEAGDGLPTIIVQTTRPRAKEMLQALREFGGLKGICFNPGEDPMDGARYDVGILQMGDGSLQLFGEFEQEDGTHARARQEWNRRCQETQGYCGLAIAMGATGASRGKPRVKDMMGLFQVRSLTHQELGLGILQLQTIPIFEL
ncbi:MAG: hypothetical protein HC925_06785 [Coleofasciculaceae cyanobacterium SM2_3_26]|nr:hypothetical protein [Coleofasciculaceae cyanobacterium SM2_3_26]